jgi:hypothetical protein
MTTFLLVIRQRDINRQNSRFPLVKCEVFEMKLMVLKSLISIS